mmetsp:Transcript_38023/g.80097  ORF Transcript_38023/g.80097 Transcript_38023/m.80097 type:complete len:96 (+) Transcript_38023:53-340(+)
MKTCIIISALVLVFAPNDFPDAQKIVSNTPKRLRLADLDNMEMGRREERQSSQQRQQRQMTRSLPANNDPCSIFTKKSAEKIHFVHGMIRSVKTV